MPASRIRAGRRKRFRLTIRLRWIALLLLGVLLLWLVLAPSGGNQRGSPARSALTSSSAVSSLVARSFHSQPAGLPFARVFYPYSVIPGGIRSVAELKHVITEDRVVALHYAAFDLQNARLVRLQRARAVYVSYRIGNHIYWTRKRVELHRGEILITDGTHTARTRCGNLVSATPVKPVSPQEPAAALLDTPEAPRAVGALEPSALPLPDLLPPQETPSLPGFSPLAGPQPAPDGGGEASIFVPPVIIFPEGKTPSNTPPVNPPVPPPLPVPEPGTLVLVLSSLPAVWLLRRRRVN